MKRNVAGQPWYEQRKQDRATHPEKHALINKDMNLRRLYGITLAQFDQMRSDQNYRCAICGRHESEIPVIVSGRPRRDGSRAVSTPLVVDHHHESAQVRKLLCPRCNHVIGHAGENPEILLAAARYLTGLLNQERSVGIVPSEK